jgi:hypothetical protein
MRNRRKAGGLLLGSTMLAAAALPMGQALSQEAPACLEFQQVSPNEFLDAHERSRPVLGLGGDGWTADEIARLEGAVARCRESLRNSGTWADAIAAARHLDKHRQETARRAEEARRNTSKVGRLAPQPCTAMLGFEKDDWHRSSNMAAIVGVDPYEMTPREAQGAMNYIAACATAMALAAPARGMRGRDAAALANSAIDHVLEVHRAAEADRKSPRAPTDLVPVAAEGKPKPTLALTSGETQRLVSSMNFDLKQPGVDRERLRQFLFAADQIIRANRSHHDVAWAKGVQQRISGMALGITPE